MIGGQILAIDPGTEQSGWCLFDVERRAVVDSGIRSNAELLNAINEMPADSLAIEMIASYGMPVGAEVFATCVWIGRFFEKWEGPDEPKLVFRRDVKLHLCGSSRAKDANIRQALIDLLGPQGTKKQPGPTFGIRSHAWAALAVAVTAAGITPRCAMRAAA